MSASGRRAAQTSKGAEGPTTREVLEGGEGGGEGGGDGV